MKLHINKIHDTHSVRSQLLRIFLLAGMFPLLVIGIFSIASVRKQMLARYESLEKADGLRVASSLNDITTTVYSSSDTLLNSKSVSESVCGRITGFRYRGTAYGSGAGTPDLF